MEPISVRSGGAPGDRLSAGQVALRASIAAKQLRARRRIPGMEAPLLGRLSDLTNATTARSGWTENRSPAICVRRSRR